MKSRKQFGVAIGSFQALQHRMAEMYIAEEQSRSMAIIAAVNAVSRGCRRAPPCHLGRQGLHRSGGALVGQEAVQMHGGMGVVDELIVSHYFKRLTMIDITLGDSDFHFARFSDSLARSCTALSRPADPGGARGL